MFGELLVSLPLLFEVWQVKSVCLKSNQGTVCVEYLLLFHVVMESWLKLNVLLQTVHISMPRANYVKAHY